MDKIFVRLVLGGLAGKVLGVAREVLLAALFGAGRVVAANRIALAATLIPINFFTADALTAGFLPLYVQYRQEQPSLAAALYRSLRSILAAFSLVLTGALLAGSAVWVGLLGPGLDSQTAGIAASMLAVGALGVPFYVQSNLYTLVCLANDDVHLVNLRASGQSIGLIAATLVAYLTGDVVLLAWGFTLPYVLLFAWGAFWVRRRGYLGELDSPESPGSARIVLGMFWRRLRPLLLIPVVLQGSIAVERAVGSILGVQALAATEYARFIVDSAMALLAAPLGLASLAHFAKMGDDQVASGLRRLIPPVLLLTVPLSLILCLNSTGIIALLYGRGQFDQTAIDTTSVILVGFGLGMWAQVLGYTFIKVLNARGANVKATAVMVLSFASAIAVNLLLYKQWGAFTFGAAASICGLVMVAGSAWALGILRFSVTVLAVMTPGVLLAGAAGFAASGPGWGRLALSVAAVFFVWIAYAMAVPRLRQPLLATVRRKASPPSGPVPQARDGDDTDLIPTVTPGSNT